VPIKSLKFISSVSWPNFASLIRRSCYNFVSLRVELNLRDFVVMTLKQRDTGACEHIINSSISIRTASSQFVTSCVKACIQYFVSVASESFYALPRADIPKLASSVNTACQTIVTSEVELAAWKLAWMTFQSKKTLASAYIPDLSCIIEWTCEQLVAICVEVKTHNFRFVPLEVENLLPCLDIPQFCGIIHRACCYKHAMRVET